MRIVWAMGEGTIREYHERTEEPRIPYTSFAYNIDNLHRKGYVKIRRVGITKLCFPLVTEEEYKKNFLSTVINLHFRNSYKEVVSFFAKNQKITAEELKEIIEIIERGEE